MEIPRAFRRWKSFPPYKVDEALSLRFLCQRDSVREYLPYLNEEYEANDSKGQLEDLEKKYALQKAEANKWENKCVYLTHQIAVSLKLIRDRTMTLEDVTKKLEDITKEVEDLRLDFESKIVMREALSKFKRRYDHDNKCLMNSAQERFPKKFPKESQDLLNFAQKDFGKLCKPCNIDKFWDLMKSAYSLPLRKFTDLMTTMYKLSLQEFSCDRIRKLIQNEPDSLSKDPDTKKKLRDLRNVIYTLFSSKDSREQAVDLMILMRNMFPRYLPSEFDDWKGKAHELFPEGFPPVRFSSTFTETIAILEKKKSSVEDKELLADIEDKLRCLGDVAMEYEWGRDFGMQVFLLCKGVSRSNIEIFHKEISWPELMSNDGKGKYTVENEDVGSAVVAFAIAKTLH